MHQKSPLAVEQRLHFYVGVQQLGSMTFGRCVRCKALCLFMKITILIKFIFFCGKNSKLLFRMKFVEGESERTNHVYCHIEKGNLIIFCKMYF